MKIQKSAIPYILLLLGLLIGVPVMEEVIEQHNQNTISIQIQGEIEVLDQYTLHP